MYQIEGKVRTNLHTYNAKADAPEGETNQNDRRRQPRRHLQASPTRVQCTSSNEPGQFDFDGDAGADISSVSLGISYKSSPH